MDTATNARQHEEKIERIRSNRDLSDQAKQRMTREVYEKAAREHQRLVTEAREAQEAPDGAWRVGAGGGGGSYWLDAPQ